MKKFEMGKAVWLILGFGLLFSGCNYNYYTGMKLEAEGRFEEANIEFHRAFTRSPNNETFKEAFHRTAQKTTEDLLNRYEQYVKEKKYSIAFRRLEQAQTLSPHLDRINLELKKWYRILLAGKVDLVQINSLSNQIPLTDQITLTVRINSPNVLKRLEAPVNYRSGIFYVEDILYDPPQDLLMMYSLNSIGVKLHNNSTESERFMRFVDFQTPVLIEVRGDLTGTDEGLIGVDKYYPEELLNQSNNGDFWYPSRGIRYALLLDKTEIKVSSSVERIDFLPHILYINKKERRYFLDFDNLQLSQKKTGGAWSFRRLVDEKRAYLTDLQKNILLNTYFFYREGGYPYVVK
ncbi:MAG: hypothetical protein HQ517_03330 [SAR324 cluster bacterium]|nr:hypothetical protein [SAR324 cluster bacterium]